MKYKFIIYLFNIVLLGCQQPISSTKLFYKNKNYAYLHPVKEEKDYVSIENNLWSFIQNELKMNIPDNHQIRKQKHILLKDKNNILQVTLKAEPYIYWIAKQIKKRNMPMEIIMLPIVESSFNPNAKSAANAVGIWQIVQNTAKKYGLKHNQWYDGRKDVFASTNTALDIIQHLNDIFKGDWLLTIAAYNSGETRVLKAIKQNKIQGKATYFWKLSLPKETKIYVPKMLALSLIIKNSNCYGINLPVLNNRRYLARVNIGNQITLTQAAKMAGISFKKLKSFNSAYKTIHTSPNGPYYILIPQSYVKKLMASLTTINKIL